MIEIPLTRGQMAIIDDNDSHLSAWKWCCRSKSKPYPATWIKTEKGKGIMISLHHCILGKPLEGRVIDHINGNIFDNRRENIRIVSSKENSLNRSCHRNQSYHSYIYFNERRNKWESSLVFNNKRKYLGSFKLEIEAKKAYEIALQNISI